MDNQVQSTLLADDNIPQMATPTSVEVAAPIPAPIATPDGLVIRPNPPAPTRTAYASVVGAQYAQPTIGPRTPTDDFDEFLAHIEHWRYTAPVGEKVFVASDAVARLAETGSAGAGREGPAVMSGG